MSQNIIDLQKSLLDKLKGGNKRYSHLNATIGRSRDKLDILCLEQISKDLSKDFIDKLLSTTNFNFKISFKNIDSRILSFSNKHNKKANDKGDLQENELFSLEEDEEFISLKTLRELKKKLDFLQLFQKEENNEFGTKSFAFGYPLLIKQMSAKTDDVICAPLYLWYLDITRDYQNDSIIISRTDENPIIFNEMLDYYLESGLKIDFKEDIQTINSEMLNDGLMDPDELDKSLKKLMGKISSKIKTSVKNESLINVPSNFNDVVARLDEKQETMMILNAGVLGIFRSGKQSIIDDLKNLIQLNDVSTLENFDINNDLKHTFSIIDTDPSQNSVITSLKNSQNLIIQGPPGTGKSQTLTALITNALSNERTTLVVCEKRTAMDIIAKNLGSLGLDNFCVLIENPNQDRTKVVDKARKIHESRFFRPNYSDEMQQAMQTYDVSSRKILNHHKSISDIYTKGFGDRKSILGKYFKLLKNNTATTNSDFKNKFEKIPFKFDLLEYNSIVKELNRIITEYIKINSDLSHVPKTKIIKSNDYNSDKDFILNFVEKKKVEFKNYALELVKARVNYIDEQLNNTDNILNSIKDDIKRILPYLVINEEAFNWKTIQNELEKIYSFQKNNSNIFQNLNNLQKDLDYTYSVLETVNNNINKSIESYSNSLNQCSNYLNELQSLGVKCQEIPLNHNLKAIFSKKEKNIARLKKSFLEELNKINKVTILYQDLTGKTIVVDENLFEEIRERLSHIPTQEEINVYIKSNAVHNYITQIQSTVGSVNISVEKYIKDIIHQQFLAYNDLKQLLGNLIEKKIEQNLEKSSYLHSLNLFQYHYDKDSQVLISNLQKILDFAVDRNVIQTFFYNRLLTLTTNDYKPLSTLFESLKISLTEGDYYEILYKIYNKLPEFTDYQSITSIINKVIAILDSIPNIINDSFYQYYKWSTIYESLNPNLKLLIELFEYNNINQSQWIDLFAYFYFTILVNYTNKLDLINNNLVIEEFLSSDNTIKKLLINLITDKWNFKRLSFLAKYDHGSQGSLGFNSLYNKRGAPGQRRNSLRKIIDHDFELFTSLFPVVICNPNTTASLFKLKKDLFDVVLFDEASQLRLEDTYTSLYRGKAKIISGDEHQMPPSNYFHSISAIEEQDIEDEEGMQIQEILNSESLLDYANTNNYLKTMLKVHYRSEHEALIEFSNKAFYSSQLIPIPSLVDYTPIEYHQVNGLYNENVNIDEAKEIIGWLENYVKNQTDKNRTIGIATLNIPQADTIKELISEKRLQDPEFNTALSEMEEKGFFIKNLENIQGDERDYILLSTTFGNRQDGKFIQNFGPLSKKNGYRLLNVLVTRAKHKFIIFSSIPEKYINTYADEIYNFGKDGKGIFYAYLAYAKAVANNDKAQINEILNRLNEDTQKDTSFDFNLQGMTESPFEEEVLALIENNIDRDRIRLQYQVGSEKFRIDMVVLDKSKIKPILAIECDGYTYHSSPDAYLYDIYRQRILESKGFKFYRIWSTNWFHDTKNESIKLINKIKELDAHS